MTPDQHTASIMKLGNLLDLEYGAALPEQKRAGFGYPVFGSNGIVGNHSKALVPGPGIVVGRKGSVGEVSWSSSAFWPIDTSYYVTPKNDVHLRWLYWVLKKTNLKKLDSATGVPGLNRNDAYELDVLVPNQEEQARIAKVLDTVDEAIRKAEALIQKLRQIREGLLHDLLTRGLDENGELRDPIAHPEQFKASPAGQLPRPWRVVPLGLICAKYGGSIQTGPFGSQLHAVDYVDQGIPIITVEHLGSGVIFHESLPCVCDKDYQRLSRYILKEDDLVFSRVGAIDRCARVTKSEDGWLFSGRCLRVRTGMNGIDSIYLAYQLNGFWCRQWIRNHAVGSTMHCLNTTILERLPVIEPELLEQRAIGRILAEHDSQVQTQEAYLNKLKAIKQGLMSDLLTGRVRVPPEVSP